MKFPYTVFPAKPDAAFPGRTSIPRPILTLSLAKGAKAMVGFALVDSGADSCIFPASWAAQLGVVIPNTSGSIFSGTADKPQIAYYDTIRIGIWNKKKASFDTSFDLYAGFCDTLEHVGVGLLGQDGFFSKFLVSFDHANSFFDVEPRPVAPSTPQSP